MKRLVLLLLLIFNFNLFAMKISIDPSHLHLTIKAGSTDRKTISVMNRGNEKLKVRVYLNDWYLKDGKKVFLPAGSTAYSLRNSIKIFPTIFELKPDEQKSVIFTLNSRKNEKDGDYGVIFFEASPVSKSKKSGVQFGGRLGSIIYKEIENKSQIVYKVTNLKSRLVGRKLFVNYSLDNKGNVLLRPKVTAMLVDNKTNDILFKKEMSQVLALPTKSHVGNTMFKLEKTYKYKKNLSVMLVFDFGDDLVDYKEIKVQ